MFFYDMGRERRWPLRIKKCCISVTSESRGMICHSRSWWRHQMETFSALLAICVGNSPITGEFPAQRPVTRSFDVFFDLRLNKRLSKQRWDWWVETPSCPLRRHCNVHVCRAVHTASAWHAWLSEKPFNQVQIKLTLGTTIFSYGVCLREK